MYSTNLDSNSQIGTYAIKCQYGNIRPMKFDNSIDETLTNKSQVSEMNLMSSNVPSNNNFSDLLNANSIQSIQQGLSLKGLNHNSSELREAVGSIIGDLIKKGKLGN
jgi:hypothetical protein